MIPFAILTGAAITAAIAWDHRRYTARRAAMHRHPSARTLAQLHPTPIADAYRTSADFAIWERELV